MARHPIGVDRALTGVTQAQRAVFDAIEQGPRGSVPSPFLAMLDAPELAEAIQSVGAVLRFGGVLGDAERELAILATAAAVGCAYEWRYHAPIAEAAGVERAVILATLGSEDAPSAGRWDTIIRFCRAVTRHRNVEEPLLKEALEVAGRQGVTELIAICGYYGLLASFILIGGHEPDDSPEADQSNIASAAST